MKNKVKINKLLSRAYPSPLLKGRIDDRILSAKYKGESRSPRGRKFNKRKIKGDERERERDEKERRRKFYRKFF